MNDQVEAQGSKMQEKKLYIWQLANFLFQWKKEMSAQELADHLNRNGFLTSYGTQFEGGVGTYRLISMTYRWVNEELGLYDEAQKIALSFVKPDGTHAWDS
jgi:hypothetical protein